MNDKPLSVAIAALIKNNKILLIKRERGDYIGFLGLPGGKIEQDEHVADAAIREIEEESGIKSSFKQHLGVVSEHLITNDVIQKHLLLHLCELVPESTVISNHDGGTLGWYDLDEIKNLKVIPSDLQMINKMILNKNSNYFECVLEEKGTELVLKRFK